MRMTTKGVVAALAAAALAGGTAGAATAAQAVPVHGVQHGEVTTGTLLGAFTDFTVTSFSQIGPSRVVISATETFTGCIDRNRSGGCDAGEPAGALHFDSRTTGRIEPAAPSGLSHLRGTEGAVSGTGDFTGARAVLAYARDDLTGDIPFVGVVVLR